MSSSHKEQRGDLKFAAPRPKDFFFRICFPGKIDFLKPRSLDAIADPVQRLSKVVLPSNLRVLRFLLAWWSMFVAAGLFGQYRRTRCVGEEWR